jgi:hypothetical protein
MFRLYSPLLVLFSFIFFSSHSLYCQDGEVEKYQRSSLSMIVVPNNSTPDQQLVNTLWSNYPFPDLYNNHNTDVLALSFDDIVLTQSEKESFNLYDDTLSGLKYKLNKALALDAATGVVIREVSPDAEGKPRCVLEPNKKETLPFRVEKSLNSNKIANKLVAKWFGYDGSSFNSELIAERGLYNASMLDTKIAMDQTTGTDALTIAGFDLISNTFLTVTSLQFFENEPAARLIKEAIYNAKETNELKQMAADKIYEKTKDGYTLGSFTRLYQLVWNDSISSLFYDEVWSNPQSIMEVDYLQVKLINAQANVSTVMVSGNKTKEEIIQLALYRNIDNCFVKLQKQNEVFKPSVPLIGADPLRASIGMKEGLTGGEKFQVYELVLDQETGETTYEEKGTIKVDKKNIWDNRYSMVDDTQEDDSPKYTQFKGSKNLLPGMLIKLIK